MSKTPKFLISSSAHIQGLISQVPRMISVGAIVRDCITNIVPTIITPPLCDCYQEGGLCQKDSGLGYCNIKCPYYKVEVRPA